MSVDVTQLTATYEAARSMNAIALTQLPNIGRVAEALKMVTLPIVRPAPDEVAIRLCASAMHIDEIFAAQGTALGRFFGPKVATPEQPHVMGSSVSGVVVGLGHNVDKFSLGDEVIVVPDKTGETGSWADYRCVNQNAIMPKPVECSHVEAAAITMAACVAWGAISFAKVKAGNLCLVVGASSSIGVMIVQYLKTLGCQVAAVCSGKNAKLVLDKGADAVIDYTLENFASQANDSGMFYDCIFDCVGGRDIERDGFHALKRTGTYVTVVGPVQYIGERKLSWFAVSKVITYVLMRMLVTFFRRPRYIFSAKYPHLSIQAALKQAVKYQLRMPVERIIPFQADAIVDAARLLTTHRARGRIVIDFDMFKGVQ